MAHRLRYGLSGDPARRLRGFLEADEALSVVAVIRAAAAEDQDPRKSLMAAAVEKLPARRMAPSPGAADSLGGAAPFVDARHKATQGRA